MFRKISVFAAICLFVMAVPVFSAVQRGNDDSPNPEILAAEVLMKAMSLCPEVLSMQSNGSSEQNQLTLIQSVMKAGTDLYKVNPTGPNGKIILSFLKAVDNAKFNFFQQDLDSANRSWKRARKLCDEIIENIAGEPYWDTN